MSKKQPRRMIPQLEIKEISLEYCEMLVPHLKVLLALIGGDISYQELADDLELDEIRDELGEIWSPEEFGRLFMTDVGKGALLNQYAIKLLTYHFQESQNAYANIEDEEDQEG